MKQPLLSIAIPTRNRQKYCISAIEDILSHEYTNFEICVHDNSDNDQIAQYLLNRTYDSRLKYCYFPERLGSVSNMNKVISMTSGKYLIMIGDDDSILPELFKTVEWADLNGVDSICPKPMVDYFWPNSHPDYDCGLLKIPIFTGKIEKVDINKQIGKLLSKGLIQYLVYYLPKVYHGIISRDLMNDIKIMTGHYFGGLSPDIYSSIALSSLVKNHYVIDYPISIAGICNKSSSSESIRNGHSGNLSSAPHFILRGEYHWDKMIPAYYSVETIWAESALKAFEEMGLADLRRKFNFNYFAAFALLRNRSIFYLAFRKTLSIDNEKVNNRLFSIFAITIYILKIVITLSFLKIYLLGKREGRPKVIVNISDISQVSSLL